MEWYYTFVGSLNKSFDIYEARARNTFLVGQVRNALTKVIEKMDECVNTILFRNNQSVGDTFESPDTKFTEGSLWERLFGLVQ